MKTIEILVCNSYLPERAKVTFYGHGDFAGQRSYTTCPKSNATDAWAIVVEAAQHPAPHPFWAWLRRSVRVMREVPSQEKNNWGEFHISVYRSIGLRRRVHLRGSYGSVFTLPLRRVRKTLEAAHHYEDDRNPGEAI